MFGLPDHFRACLFDLDGVLTPTAEVHAAARKELFDEVLARDAERAGRTFVPSDLVADYQRYVNGRARVDGARPFLASRDIASPEGSPDDPPGAGTGRKDRSSTTRLLGDGALPYPGSLRDGAVASAERLPGTPAPDTFLAAAARLGVAPREAAVFEDALAGVEAGRAGGSGFMVGVARDGAAGEPLARGADVVVNDLEELLGR